MAGKSVCYLHFKTRNLSSVNTQYMYDLYSCPFVIFCFVLESSNFFHLGRSQSQIRKISAEVHLSN